jgi:hypothetical protein
MNPLLFWLAAAAGIAAAQISAPLSQSNSSDKARIEGRVVNAISGEPVRRATIRLNGTSGSGPVASMMMNLPPAPGGPQVKKAATGPMINRQRNYTAITDGEGRFALEVDSGRYSISAHRDGFLSQSYGSRSANMSGTTVVVDAGARKSNIDFKLTPHGIISGRVTDGEGEPVRHVQVFALRWGYRNGKRELVQAGGNMSPTNDLGEFRIYDLPPGNYYLRAQPQRMQSIGADNPPGPEEGLASVYYPASPIASGAARIDVAPGAEVRGINFQLNPTRVYRIKGMVLGLDGAPVRNANVWYSERERTNSRSGNMTRGPDGSFIMMGVLPGSYVLGAEWREGPSLQGLAGPVYVDVASGNVENVILQLVAPFDVAGTMKVVGQFTGRIGQLQLIPDGGVAYGPPPRGEIKEDGSFVIKGVAAERYRLPLPLPGYVKSMKLAGREVDEPVIDFSSGSRGPLEIVVSTEGGEISGKIENSNGEPVERARVVIVPVSSPRERVQGSVSDQSGMFRTTGLAPGDYKIYAWEMDIEPGAEQDPAFRKLFDSYAVSVKIEDKAKQTINVKLVPRDVMEAEKAKM